jgi:hypothetical protein
MADDDQWQDQFDGGINIGMFLETHCRSSQNFGDQKDEMVTLTNRVEKGIKHQKNYVNHFL